MVFIFNLSNKSEEKLNSYILKIKFYLMSHFSVTFNLILICHFVVSVSSCTKKQKDQYIDRYSLVERNNIILNKIDILGSLSVGNGEFAYTVDITGMQTFPMEYERGVSLGTQSQWGWHTTPSDSNYTLNDVAVNFESCNDKSVPYAIQHRSGRAANAANWLRSNPHRLHLGIVGLSILNSKGKEIQLDNIENPKQYLNLWTGKISSEFEVEGVSVKVETICHQEQDVLSFKIVSQLIKSDRLKIKVNFPYGNECHVCPGYDWEHPDKHQSEIIEKDAKTALIKRTLDSTNYFVHMNWQQDADLTRTDTHFFMINPADNDTFEYSISFTPQNNPTSSADMQKLILNYAETENNSKQNWKAFWESGGVLDFSECTDPRADELERRVVLSQYLMKIQCSGSLPPQETGLTFNSWYGKFHLEMHWWHAVHFALWGRTEYLEKSLNWYFDNLESARKTAEWQGYEGVRWQKMTSPSGQSSPSSVGEFLVWQQPHIIYFAELLYRTNPTGATLEKYKNLVFETAEFMASYAQLDSEDGLYHLCPPLIPAQEHFSAAETSDPAFELSYWNWGLKTAQKWRARLDLKPNEKWHQVIENLAPIPSNENYYLPTAEASDAFENYDKRRDHPIVIGSYGFLSNECVDVSKMSNTFDEVMREWNWQSTWGWDYPLLAMTATNN